jgi:DNA-directed RNA polymerase specialized sigma24 family protein
MFAPSPYTSEVVRLTKAQETELIKKYQKTGKESIAETLLKARAPWVQSVLSNFDTPDFADMDNIFSDAMIRVYMALSNYQENVSSVSTYLWKVVNIAWIESVNEQRTQSETCEMDLVVDGKEDYSECLDNVRRVILNAPQEMMNERARRVAHMLLKGQSTEEIANAIPCTKAVADEVVSALRKYIAWMMVSEGLSADPVITDQELYDLAVEHEKSSFSCWK